MSSVADDLCALVGLDGDALTNLMASLADRHLTVAVAESLTGGLVSALLTEIPGASAVLRGAIVCYATELKHALLGVEKALLDAVGPVDAEVARQLAVGVRQRCGADLGLALTGVAGPGWQDGKAPGTVFVAISSDGYDEVRALAPSDRVIGRQQIRAAAARAAIDLLSDASTEVRPRW